MPPMYDLGNNARVARESGAGTAEAADATYVVDSLAPPCQ